MMEHMKHEYYMSINFRYDIAKICKCMYGEGKLRFSKPPLRVITLNK